MNLMERTDRIVYLDVLRGFALCGILFVNMPSFLGERLTSEMGQADQVLRLLFDLFIQTKFYTLFSVLFGAGFILFIDRLRVKGKSLWIFVRRLTILFVFGLIHLLFWKGDILQTYALSGFFLLLFVKTRPTAKLFVGIALQLYTFFLYVSIYMYARSEGDQSIVEPDGTIQELVASRQFIDYISYHATVQLPQALSNTLTIFPEILSLFLIGAYLMERFTIRPPATRTLALIFGISLVVSFPALYQIIRIHQGPVPDGLANYFFVWLSGRTLAVTYAAGVALLLRSGRSLSGFQVLGRMALTNYLMQTMVFTALIFLTGMYGTIPLWQGTLSVIVLLAVQVVFSNWYLNRHRQGPIEAVWRAGTYGRTNGRTK
ncbi:MULTISPECIES: DUF418 domain-containing protein [Exiguobacterium]|uniref:DUF418 domain-containing protein n=1 Tax=Exiguobacterium TaxID=33986 RepID=UPI001AE9BA7B|nr:MULTISPECIES: DUF418 domain-containing protein [Exiguobacterium]MCT4779278.1 DUF418 domain-containing protein [Exiguobacterium soli]